MPLNCYKLDYTLYLIIKKKLSMEYNELSRRNLFKAFLNSFVSFAILFMEVGKWLKILIPALVFG